MKALMVKWIPTKRLNQEMWPYPWRWMKHTHHTQPSLHATLKKCLAVAQVSLLYQLLDQDPRLQDIQSVETTDPGLLLERLTPRWIFRHQAPRSATLHPPTWPSINRPPKTIVWTWATCISSQTWWAEIPRRPESRVWRKLSLPAKLTKRDRKISISTSNLSMKV